MTFPVPGVSQGVFATGNVAMDTPCRKCGYNLRGLAMESRCPECGTPVGISVSGDLLRYSDPAFVDTLRRGVNFILWGILAVIVFAIAGVALAGASRGAANQAVGLLMLIGYIPMLVGAWLLTSPDPSGIGENEYGKPRKIIRIALVAGLGSDLLQLVAGAAKPPPAMAMALASVVFVIAMVRLVGQFAQLYYLQKLANRIPDGDLSERARFLMWAIGISYGIVLVIGFAAIVLAAGGGGQFGGAMAGVGCFAGIAGIAMIIFGVMYLFMLGRFSARFREQAAVARQIWARSTAGPAGGQG